MSSNSDPRVKELFLEALECSPAEREAFLRERCGDEPTRQAVLRLLAASGKAGEFLEEMGEALRGTTNLGDGENREASAGDVRSDLAGTRIGPYRLDSLLGRGGMGAVYRAERIDGQFRQTVAIKVLALGAMHPETQRRFLAEREILARLRHPNIAQLFDGGVTEDGTPFYVMPLVEGSPIDVHADEHRLDVGARLKLFLQVCDAVAHAHREKIVHRDLKPANVLVSEGQVTLLDFGIAKLLESEEGAFAVQTGSDASPMTPAYASPEQLLRAPIRPATDVYALGVLLYQLLTGAAPYEASEESHLALMNAICREPVARPSVRVRGARAKSPAQSGAIAEARGCSSESLTRRLAGDLDAIVLQCLAKEPERRYANAAELAEDLRRHLDGFPVRARSRTWTYEIGRLIARHRGASRVAGVAIIVIAVLGVVAVFLAVSNSRKSEELADQRQSLGELLTRLSDLYADVDPDAPAEENAATITVLEAAVQQMREDPSSDRETLAKLSFAAGRVYRRLEMLEAAEPLFEDALSIRRELFESPHEELSAALYSLGSTLSRSGRVQPGIDLLREALEMEIEMHGTEHVHVAQIRFELAVAYHDAGTGEDAPAEFREAIRIYRGVEAAPSVEYADAVSALASYVGVVGDKKEAIALFEEAVALYEELLGPTHRKVAASLNGLGMLVYYDGRREEGIAMLGRAVSINRSFAGEMGSTFLASNLVNLGVLMSEDGDERGVERLREGVAMHRGLTSSDPTTLGFAMNSLAYSLRNHDPDEARAIYEEALEVFEKGDVPPMYRASTKSALATLLRREGHIEEARRILLEVANTYEATLGKDNPRTRAAFEEVSELR